MLGICFIHPIHQTCSSLMTPAQVNFHKLQHFGQETAPPSLLFTEIFCPASFARKKLEPMGLDLDAAKLQKTWENVGTARENIRKRHL